MKYEEGKALLRKMARESGDEAAVDIVEKAIADTDASLQARKAELDANPQTLALVWGVIQQRR